MGFLGPCGRCGFFADALKLAVGDPGGDGGVVALETGGEAVFVIASL